MIQMIVDKAKKAGLSTIFDIMDQVFPMIKTTVSKTEILKLLPTMIGYNIENTTGFPEDYNFATVKGSVIVPTTLESNVLKLHQFLYGATNYTPTQEVMNKSEQIISIAGGGDVQTDTQDGTETSENNSYVYNADDSEDMDYSAENNVDNTDYSTENNVDDTDYSVENNTDDTDYSGDDYNSGSDDSEYDSDYTADYDDNFSDDE